MNKQLLKKIFILFFIIISFDSNTQEKELFDLIITDENATPKLLPERIIFTQKIFWGENGILRKTGIAPLNLENREKELKLRKRFSWVQYMNVLQQLIVSTNGK